ncbi:MAG: type II toxin-antitoxin system Phd/YefM family antitoxin [Verrucomicrobia bacterium]|nr:type II toxin-antitoxin system Phd/YefM family antitoxin [Verrucomicrobiota bacterium]
MKTVNVHDAKTRFSRLLADIEASGTGFVICRNGHPVAELVPHRPVDRLAPDKKLGKIRIRYNPVEEISEKDWPREAR